MVCLCSYGLPMASILVWSSARRRRSCSSPWRGRRSPEAAPGAQLRPGAPRHASRRAPGEGAAWPRTTRQRRRRRRQRQELRRLRGPGQAPATSPGGGSGGGGGCAAPAPLLLLQLLPSGPNSIFKYVLQQKVCPLSKIRYGLVHLVRNSLEHTDRHHSHMRRSRVYFQIHFIFLFPPHIQSFSDISSS